MFFQAPTHKNNTFDVQIKGNFRDSKDSFYSISEKDFVHITFVKREDKSIWRRAQLTETLKELPTLSNGKSFISSGRLRKHIMTNWRARVYKYKMVELQVRRILIPLFIIAVPLLG